MSESLKEQLQWVKDRALECLPGDPSGALSSFLSDMRKHCETRQHPGLELTLRLLAGGHLQTARQVREHIEGFN